jgi:hypothetical protein
MFAKSNWRRSVRLSKRQEDCSELNSWVSKIPDPTELKGCDPGEGWQGMITVKSTQKVFTEAEISRLTGICTEHLRGVARSKHLGSIVRAAGAVGGQAEGWLFTNTDLSVLVALFPRCEH